MSHLARRSSPPGAEPTPAGTERRLGLRGRVLVVEGDPGARCKLKEYLRSAGYVAEASASAWKALAKLDELAPHVLLTDLYLPGMDGVELMQRARERDPGLLTIVMTSQRTVDTAIAVMREGAQDCLSKPIHLEELAIVLERAWARQRLRGEGGSLRQRLAQEQLVPEALPTELTDGARRPEGPPKIPGASLSEIERYAILETLKETGGSTLRAAQLLGVSPRKIQYRLREYGAKALQVS